MTAIQGWRQRLCALLCGTLLIGLLPFSPWTAGEAHAIAGMPNAETILFADDGSSMSAAGWTANRAPENGLYATDAANSLGNPNGVTMKPVDAGQYLLFGDQTAGNAGHYTLLSRDVTIGPGAWTVELSARIADLMTPSRYAAERGFGIDLFADHKRFKLSFNDRNKIS
ncbi:MAG: hypothetical protein J7639_29230, partial [Paenibacillaceae bacterium]|nr:hypothetical protein [Paenibacillaceae bacterium]